jgi:glycosyltransferase involved in cell wall biosynthesis
MLLSTIIPTVNRPTLKRAVLSALEQEFEPELHEIIVFNNSDQPLPDSDWLRSPKVTIVNSHSGFFDAFNKGAELASGKYIHVLPDDDYLLPGGLKALVDLAENTGCYWVCGAYNLVDDDGNFISVTLPHIKGNIFALLVGGECLQFPNSLIDRKAFLRVGGFDPELPWRADLDRHIQCQLALLSDFDSTNQPVAAVRLSGGEVGTADWSWIVDDHRIFREKELNLPGALPRMRDSVQGDIFLRGRACRAYLISAILNLKDGNFNVASDRFLALLRLSGLYPLSSNYWRGLFYRHHLADI